MPQINSFVIKSPKLKKLLSNIFIFLIRLYQVLLSPLLGPGKCRYTPSCSDYSLEAIRKYGTIRGGWMGLKRILRCAPWGGHGFDPVP